MEFLNGFVVGFVFGFAAGLALTVWLIYHGHRKKIKKTKVLAVFKGTEPGPHWRVHFDDRVEFWDLSNRKTGESKVTGVA